MSKLPTPGQVYDRYLYGYLLSEQELEVGLTHFKKLHEMLIVSGEDFRDMAIRAHHIHQDLRNYRNVRSAHTNSKQLTSL